MKYQKLLPGVGKAYEALTSEVVWNSDYDSGSLKKGVG
jgi:hypothetical protein